MEKSVLSDREVLKAFMDFRIQIKWLEAENLMLRERVIKEEGYESKAWQAGWDNCSKKRRDRDKCFNYQEWKKRQHILEYSRRKS